MAKILGTAGSAPASRRRRRQKPPTRHRTTTAPVSDAQSSGSDYGLRKAEAYKKTPAGRAPVVVARRVTVRDINTGKTHQVTVKERLLNHPHNQGADALGFLLKGFNKVYGQNNGSGGRHLSSGGGAMVGPIGGGVPAEVVKANLQEGWRNPGKTLKGFGEEIAAIPAAAGAVGVPLAQGVGHLMTLHPGRALTDVKNTGRAVSRIGSGMAKDYSARYGPLIRGDVKAYEAGVRKSGAAAGLTDILTAATVGGGVARPLTRGLVRTLPKGAEFLDAPRPNLRVSGSYARPQELSVKPTRVAVQRAQDLLRAKKQDHVRFDSRGRKAAMQPRMSAVEKSVARQNAKRARTGAAPVPMPKPNEVSPIFNRLLKREGINNASRHVARSFVAVRHEGQHEVSKGYERALAGLNRHQRQSVYHVLQGLVPLHGTVDEIVQALKDRRTQLEAAGAPRHTAKVLRGSTELATIDHLITHADEIFGPGHIARLRAFHRAEVARNKKITESDSSLRSATAEARRRRPQGEMLGIEYKPPEAPKTKTGAVKQLDEAGRSAYMAERDAYNHDYAQRVAKEAHKRGLPDPAYFEHVERPEPRLSLRTGSNLAKAISGPKQSAMDLFNTGRAVTDPEVYAQGLRATIKRKHQWKHIADIIDEHAYSWSRGRNGGGMTLHRGKQAVDKMGLRHEDISWVNLGRFRRAAKDEVHDDSTALGELVKGAVQDGKVVDRMSPDEPLLHQTGFVAVPTHIAKELQASLAPVSPALAHISRLQGLQSAAILGLNPSWLQMQVAANMLQSGVSLRGNFGDLLAAHKWYRKLDPKTRRMVDESLGVGVYEGNARAVHLGAHQGKVGMMLERAGQIPLIRTPKGVMRITDLNPTQMMFRADHAQTLAFRRAVLYNDLKRQHFRRMRRDIGTLQAAMAKLHGSGTGKLERETKALDQAAEMTDRVLGDYLRYTARERRGFRPFVMFYGFMRYSLKTLLHTLPIKHPMAGSIALKLGQLHDEEVRQIFGTHDLPVWDFSRVYQYDEHNRPVREPLIGKDGKQLMIDGKPQWAPQAIDLGRINPITSPITEMVDKGPKALAGFVSPAAQSVFNIITNTNVSQGRPLTAGGVGNQAPHTFSDYARIFANETASALLPYRLIMPKGRQTDDALPWSPRPIHYKTQAAQTREDIRQAGNLHGAEGLLQQLFPLNYYKPDTTAAYLDAHKKKPKGRGGAPRIRLGGGGGGGTHIVLGGGGSGGVTVRLGGG